MRYTHLRRTDLNLLLALQALVEERSVSRAAERLHITQPAMSRVLDRLQELFGDEIVVRRGRAYEPTHRALQAYAELERLLPRLDAVVRGGTFDAATTTETFRIHAPDYAAMIGLPELTALLTSQAPHARLAVANPAADPLALLESGRVDVAAWLNAAREPFVSEVLYEERLAVLVRQGHPLAKGRVTLDRLLSFRHVELQVHGQAFVDQLLAQHDRQRMVALQTPYLASAAAAVERTDLVLAIPLLLARRFAQLTRTVVRPVPAQLPPFSAAMVWHQRMSDDPAHAWFRAQVRQAVKRQVANLGRDHARGAFDA